MSTQSKPFLTPEQYLEIERKADFKSEYFRGEMFAMAGASLAHNRLVTAVTSRLCARLAPAMANISPRKYSLLKSAFRSISRYCSGVRKGLDCVDMAAPQSPNYHVH